MAKKIYDFLPAHLRNDELESIFDATLERAFSKGSMQKEKSFLGRKEKGVYTENDTYMDFPSHLYQRDNYGLEPVFSNTEIGDNIYYDDLLNAMQNKGMLTNDHRRLFETKIFTLNLPIDQDKFINWSLYYWVNPGFFPQDYVFETETGATLYPHTVVESEHKHYVTIEKTLGNWWSENNAWYHYDDIRHLITSDNKKLIEQAKRPIIEFDKLLSPENESQIIDNQWVEPRFYADNGNSYKLFGYVTGENYPVDTELNLRTKMKAGDYKSEFVFHVDLPSGVNVEYPLYVECEFNYRNLRHEVGLGKVKSIELTQSAKSENDIDVYLDGMKQIGNYTLNDDVIEFDSEVEGYVYVDYCTQDNVVIDGDNIWQRINPALEYNIDNEIHNQKEMTYSHVYEHMARLIETTDGLTGQPNGVNNYRFIGENKDKTRFNSLGSVLIYKSIDLKKAYFAITRDDYDPVKSVEFLSASYNNFKNRFITQVRRILTDPSSSTKSDTAILEESIRDMSLTKRASISIFDGSDLINFGHPVSHYTAYDIDVTVATKLPKVPNALTIEAPNEKDLNLYVNGKLQRYIVDYTIDLVAEEIQFVDYVAQPEDVITIRHYEKLEEVFIPPSATKLKINELYIPEYVYDDGYDNTVKMIKGHDGSLIPAWDDISAQETDRTNDILLEFETLIYNRLVEEQTSYKIKKFDYGIYDTAKTSYSLAEKKFIQYPFFKKWMILNNIDNMYNDTYDSTDWKTWNYRSLNEVMPGHWRGIMKYIYGTDNPIAEPWVTVGYAKKPDNFDINGTDYLNAGFWENLKSSYNKDWPVPVANRQLRTIDDLFYGSSIDLSDISLMNQDWEFGDGSPTELAWTRSSEYPFIEFLTMLLTKPFEIITDYEEQIDNIISYYHARDGFNTENVTEQRNNYTFKLGSKLGGFVNNFKILRENSSINNATYIDVPKDNYDLFVHAGEPNRSESFSAIVLEKVSMDKGYPKYDISDVTLYKSGDIVYNAKDKKYYKRKHDSVSQKEQDGTVAFDYSQWTLISQPNIREFGYRIHGYDDFNPVFFALDWDKSSGTKVWSSEGDELQPHQWSSGTYYKQDTYALYNNKPYISLKSHTSSTLFDTDIKNWKLLKTWPRTNVVQAYGYKELMQDQIKSYNYGDILTSIDEVAHLMIGYQEYLKLSGWSFSDTDENGEVLDYENLLVSFLEWSVEQHQPGDFITLTPVIRTGSFDAPYGISSVSRETNKNYYRAVDEFGKKIKDTDLKFNTDGSRIFWDSNIPVYSMKIDVADIEHAFVIDREDSYSDTIYDPFSHNRNLRVLIDCNRTTDWDGTLTAEGYLVYNNELIPNLDTMVAETRYYRDTIVDQGLMDTNKLKASQIGYTPKSFLLNHGVERESQLEFYKGFLAGKATVSSINRIISKNSNFTDIKHKDIWAIKLSEYGKTSSLLTASAIVNTVDIVSDPHVVHYDIKNKMPSIKHGKAYAIKTAGYVNPNDVNYLVDNSDTLETSEIEYFEGDLAWVRFDDDRDWDVKRLSEISEISYVAETNDGQLKIALTNEIDVNDTAYLNIVNSNVDPEIQGNYYFVKEAERNENGITVYEYLVFDQSYEPLIVEIDSSTDNSIYVPTNEDSGVQAIGFVSNPSFNDGDTIFINGEKYEYDSSSSTITTGITIGGQTSTSDPIVQAGDKARIIVYNENGSIQNSNTLITFNGTSIVADNTVSSNEGDKVIINGDTLTVDYSSTQSIRAVSSATTSTFIATGKSIRLQSGSNDDTLTFKDISVSGNASNPEVTENKSIRANGVQIDFVVPAPITGADSVENQSNVATPTSSITLSTDMTSFLPGEITITGSSNDNVLTTSDYTYANNVITFNSPITDLQIDDDGDPLTPDVDDDGVVNLSIELIAQPVSQALDTQGIVTAINSSGSSVTAALDPSNNIVLTSSDSKLEVTGSALFDLGFGTNSINESKLNNIAQEINQLSYITAFISNNVLVIETNQSELTISGDSFNDLGFPTNTYQSTTDPTVNSIVQQLVALNIQDVSASVETGKLKLTSSSDSLVISEHSDTPGAMSRLGFTSTSVNITAIDSIVADINSALTDPGLGTVAIKTPNRSVQINSSQASILISNVSGNPLGDIGIIQGTYTNNNLGSSSTLLEFKDQINAAQNIVTVSVTSDGRMVFSSNTTKISFSGTSDDIMNKIGLYREYTNVTSNADFKIMRWKSVRFTPGYNGAEFIDFYEKLGLNDTSLIWVDDYLDMGWAVLERNALGTLNVKNRKATPVDTDYVDRMVTKIGDNFIEYNLYDPLNLKMPGSIIKDIDYISWNDPAKYDLTMNDSLWLSHHLGEIWWDTDTARYYKYDDFGDANGNVDINYAKRFWGKLVPGSSISIKQWVTSEVLPAGISHFNTEVYYDANRNKNVTNYYYWTDVGIDPKFGKEFSIEEIKMILETPTTINSFFPVDNDTIIVSNNANILTDDTIEYKIQYNITSQKEKSHTDWELISRKSRKPLDDYLLDDFKKSISGIEVKNYSQIEISSNEITSNGVEFSFDWFGSADKSNMVVSVNSKIVLDDEYTLSGSTITIPSISMSLIENDVIRVYEVKSFDSWFSNMQDARDNFKSSLIDVLSNRMFNTAFPLYDDYIVLGDGIFTLNDWYISDLYKTINKYEYLSKTRNIDMISLYNSGVSSFKIETKEHDEYYFPIDDEIRLVHKTNSVLDLRFDVDITDNQIGVQLYELMDMIYQYADVKTIKTIVFDMIEYMYTEKTYPEWIFKTSYIDLTMYNKPLRQYAIYQRDTYNDTVDYVIETKPYHVKLREIERIYPVDEHADFDIEAKHHMTITKFFGNHSRFELNTIDGVDETPTKSWDDEVDVDYDTLPLLSDGVTYEAGGLLRNDIEYTETPDGFDTGEFRAQTRDASVVKVTTYTDDTKDTIDNTEFYVYDMYGRGYHVKVVDPTENYTIDSFDGENIVVNQPTKFKQARGKTKRLVAIEDSNGNVEFMSYNSKSGTNLKVFERASYNGLASSFASGDRIYVLDVPNPIYSLEDV